MGRTRRVRKWLGERRVEGVLRVLERSSDRAAALVRLSSGVDDGVLAGMVDFSRAAGERGDDEECLAWAELAVEASLHGGTLTGRAETLLWHARVQLDRWPGTLTDRPRGLGAAQRGLEEVFGILDEIGTPVDRAMALSLRARVHTAFARGLDAFQDSLSAAELALECDDEELLAHITGYLSRQYKKLPDDPELAIPRQLIAVGERILLRIGDAPPTPALRDALGDAHRQLDDERRAHDQWITARHQYAARGDSAGVFEMDVHLVGLAVEGERYTEAIELGERVLADHPSGVRPGRLAELHHVLGAVHRELGQVDEAWARYEKAISLAEADSGPLRVSAYLVDAALYAIDTARPDAALSHLLKAYTSSSGPASWLAALTLAELHLSHFGDVASAKQFAEWALDRAILDTHTDSVGSGNVMKDPAVRACSLHRAGLAAFGAGDIETAYRRFHDLVPLLTEDMTPPLIELTSTYSHPVVPPALSGSIWWAYLTSRQTGREEEARAHLARYSEVLATGTGLFDGFELVRTDPERALDQLRAILETVSSFTPPPLPLIGLVRSAIGTCHVRLGQLSDAAAVYGKALSTVNGSGGHWEVEFSARSGLAFIAESDGDLVQAEQHLSRVVELTEKSRGTLTGVDERIGFLAGRLNAYERLIILRIRLGRTSEAYGTTQLVKSRTLGELLAGDEHRPIDHALEAELAALRREQDDWLSTHVARPATPSSEALLDMLQPESHRRNRQRAAENSREQRKLFTSLPAPGPPMSYTEVRSLLT
ncbi:tetratricopeptide repeat protein [Streptomyces sp. NBC_00582]|uniref:tetratricopeptide repeat protein n=1 Tax=Streptomyces sp. NBC_00582 TaxID=2975783 RepID=UPI002E817A35|nr:tetratricopeptide repeat protein [Streptomyces sp. NBC_00582]WUB67070.1 tetratricopeptide repeat protein [Streptomyces sp. NBC_00582]